MKIGDAELERGNDGAYTYEVQFFVKHLAKDVVTVLLERGRDIESVEVLESETDYDIVEWEEDRREDDGSDDSIEHVHANVWFETQTQFTREIEVTDGSCRGDFDKARIKTILREEGIEPDQVQEISGGVEERTVFLHG